MGTVFKDIRYGARMLLRTPGFTVVAVLVTGLGIGANTAIFSVVHSVLLRSLPLRDPSSLVMVWERSRLTDRNVVSPANYLDWKSRNHVFGDLAAVVDILRVNLTGAGEPEELVAGAVSANFFQMIGVQPMMGRAFLPGDDRTGHEHVVILSHRLWQRRFGHDAGLIGRNIVLNGVGHEVIGVLPPDFAWNNRRTDVWMPYVIEPNRDYRATSGRFMTVAARLRADVTLPAAQAEMSAIARQLEVEHPEFNRNWGVNLVPLQEQTVGHVRRALTVLMGAVAFVLLIACVNVANLLLARAATRQREIAVRAALGAGRRRLIRQLLAESGLLAAAGGLLGLLLAGWGIQFLVSLAPPDLPRLSEIGIHPAVFAFTALTSLATGILFGLVPAVELSRTNLNEALKSGGRSATGDARRHRLRSLLVVSETALALVLMIAAGLLIRSFGRLAAVDPGFNPDHLLTLRVQLASSKYEQDPQVVSFFQQAVERVGHLPGVRNAGAINFLPLTGLDSATGFRIVGQPAPRPGENPVTEVDVVDPGYFRTMGIPLLRGRSFTAHDTKQSQRVLIISATLARRFFPHEDPIGKKLIIQWDDSIPDEIVGVVGDVLHYGLDTQPWPVIYWPHARMPYNFMTLVVRAQGDPMTLAPAAIQQIRGIDPDQPVADVRAMSGVLSESVSRQRFNMLLLAILAGVALVLAAAGIYGVVAYGVAERTHEIGIRLALGAARRQVLSMVLRNGVSLALAGIGIGVAGALLLTRLMTSLLFGVTATDPFTYAGLAFVLVLVALLAGLAPAVRATNVDPMVSLRYE